MKRADWHHFTEEMGRLGLAFNREITEPLLTLYWQELAELELAEFAHAAQAYRRRETEPYRFPPPGALLALARPATNAEAHAAEAFERVCKLAEHDARTGPYWRLSRVAASEGAIVAEAFVAAGGSRAFAGEQTEQALPFLRRRFVQAYVTALEAARAGRILAPPESVTRALPGSPAAELVATTARALGMDRKRLASGEPGGDT